MNSFEYSVEGSTDKTLVLIGKIDEDARLEEAIASISETKVTVDLSQITALNSYGVRVWINAFKAFSNKQFTFKKIPTVIINQMNMISNFMPGTSIIESYFAPYYCENCDTEEDILYHISDTNVIETEQNCKNCNSLLEFDELEDEYFLFLKNSTRKVLESPKLFTSNIPAEIIVAIEGREEFGEKLSKQISTTGHNVKTITLDTNKQGELLDNIDKNTKLVVCGYKDTDESLSEIEDLKRKHPALKIIMLTEDKLKKILVEDWIHSFYPDNIITFEYENLDNDIKEINTVISKILSNEIFGMDRYLSDNRKTNEITIKTAKEKQAYLDKIMSFAESNSVRKRILSSIEQISDELIMNAIYNAPADDTGKDKYKMVVRSEKIDLQEDEFAHLKYGIDEDKFIISVTDYFGRLTKDKVLGYLHKCFSDTNFSVNEESGGAGLGLYIIYSKVQQFIINIKPGVKTEVITSFYLNKRAKDNQDKMFHIFIS